MPSWRNWVDAMVSKAISERSEGSSPSEGTKNNNMPEWWNGRHDRLRPYYS